MSLLSTAKGRAKLRTGLAHTGDLDHRFVRLIRPGLQSVDRIEEILKKKGAPVKCHALSENGVIDGRDLLLREALEETVGRGLGTFLSCVEGRLAYFEGEDAGSRFICER